MLGLGQLIPPTGAEQKRWLISAGRTSRHLLHLSVFFSGPYIGSDIQRMPGRTLAPLPPVMEMAAFPSPSQTPIGRGIPGCGLEWVSEGSCVLKALQQRGRGGGASRRVCGVQSRNSLQQDSSISALRGEVTRAVEMCVWGGESVPITRA